MTVPELVVSKGLLQLSTLVLLAMYTRLQANLPVYIASIVPILEFPEPFSSFWVRKLDFPTNS